MIQTLINMKNEETKENLKQRQVDAPVMRDGGKSKKTGWGGFETGWLRKSTPNIETHVNQFTGNITYVLRIGKHDCEEAEFEVLE